MFLKRPWYFLSCNNGIYSGCQSVSDPLSPRDQDLGALYFVQSVVMILLFCLQFLISFEVQRLTLYFILNFICTCAIICILYYKKDILLFIFQFIKIILNETILPSLKYIPIRQTTRIIINNPDNPEIIATGKFRSLFAIGSFPFCCVLSNL